MYQQCVSMRTGAEVPHVPTVHVSMRTGAEVPHVPTVRVSMRTGAETSPAMPDAKK